MDKKNLTELIEKAASSINMITPQDTSELDALGVIMNQMTDAVGQIEEIPAQLSEQIKGKSSDASAIVQKILKKEAQDTAKSLDMLSEVISAVQKLTVQLESGDFQSSQPKPYEQKAESDKKETAPAPQIINEEDAPLVLDFIAEASEHLEACEAGLLALENKPDDSEVLNQIFRGFHTIKGMSGFLNITQVGSLAHSSENLLDLARKGKLLMTGHYSDVIFESIDMLKKMLTSLKVSVESASPVAVFVQLPQMIAKLKAAADGNLDQSQVQKPQKEQAQSAAEQKELKKVDTEIEKVLDVKPIQSAVPAAELKETSEKNEVVEIKESVDAKVSADKSKAAVSDDKIKVTIARLDNLVNMTGELVIAQLMVSEEIKRSMAFDNELSRKISHQSKIVRELQELTMSMRMVPICGVFQKMARLVRDLSHKAGKNVNFATFGEETELDRTIVDKIHDPLVHMVRNSMDHGIESAEERAKSGKNPVGKLELKAYHQSGNIVIEITDDGKGLNKDRILKKAIENGLVSSDQQLTDDQIYKLIFHAGLSTAEKVTAISGRGVGMDVVKKNIESLRGKIDIYSTIGKGTTFAIRLPLTLAVIDGQIIKVGQEKYVIPINTIVNSFRPQSGQISSIQGKGEMVLIRGETMPLLRLYRLFNIKPTTEDPTKSLLVIVEEDNKKCCLLVDELLGQQQVVIKNLGDGLGRVKGVAGGSIMGDGKVSLILDIPSLVELAKK